MDAALYRLLTGAIRRLRERVGNARVYDARTGTPLQELLLATGTAPTFLNDAVATKRAVCFTDAQRPDPLIGGLPARLDAERQDSDRRPERLAPALHEVAVLELFPT